MIESFYPKVASFVPDREYTTCFLEELVAEDPKLLTDVDIFHAISFVFRSNHPTPLMDNGEIRIFDGNSWIALGCDSPFRRKPYFLSWISRVGCEDTYEFRLRENNAKTYIADYNDIPAHYERVYHTAVTRQKIANDLLHGQLIGVVRVVA